MVCPPPGEIGKVILNSSPLYFHLCIICFVLRSSKVPLSQILSPNFGVQVRVVDDEVWERRTTDYGRTGGYQMVGRKSRIYVIDEKDETINSSIPDVDPHSCTRLCGFPKLDA